MDNFLRFFRGESHTTFDSIQKDNDSEIVDESGFVLVDSQCSRIIQEVPTQSSPKQFGKDTCSSSQVVESMTTNVGIKKEEKCSDGPINTMCSIPMQLSYDLQTFNNLQTYVNKRQHLNLDLYNYDFSLEISVLSQNPEKLN